MSTFAGPQDAERHRAELEARTRVAWRDYHQALHELEGREYEDAEPASWDQLQATLNEIEGEREPGR
jgi:hypothetical protein